MTNYTAVNGTEYSDEDIEQWAADHERGYTGDHLGPAIAGPPVPTPN